jgi:hypothetical protein
MSTRDLLVTSWLSRACDARLLDRLPGQWSAFLSLSVLHRLLVESKVQSYSQNKLWVNQLGERDETIGRTSHPDYRGDLPTHSVWQAASFTKVAEDPFNSGIYKEH